VGFLYGGFVSAVSLVFFWIAIVGAVVIGVPLLAAVFDKRDERARRLAARRRHPTFFGKDSSDA
jgi:hypothetical protein